MPKYLPGPTPGLMIPRRRRNGLGLVFGGCTVLVAALVMLWGTAGRRSNPSGATRPGPSPGSPCGHNVEGVRDALGEIREASAEAQLGIRISVPLVAEQGNLPVTTRRLQRSDVLLSVVLRAAEAAEAALQPNLSAAPKSRTQGEP